MELPLGQIRNEYVDGLDDAEPVDRIESIRQFVLDVMDRVEQTDEETLYIQLLAVVESYQKASHA